MFYCCSIICADAGHVKRKRLLHPGLQKSYLHLALTYVSVFIWVAFTPDVSRSYCA